MVTIPVEAAITTSPGGPPVPGVLRVVGAGGAFDGPMPPATGFETGVMLPGAAELIQSPSPSRARNGSRKAPVARIA
ncbi:MAG: hypothetical protein ACREGI_02810 [Candidatus Levyibacteriota bacterium]